MLLCNHKGKNTRRIFRLKRKNTCRIIQILQYFCLSITIISYYKDFLPATRPLIIHPITAHCNGLGLLSFQYHGPTCSPSLFFHGQSPESLLIKFHFAVLLYFLITSLTHLHRWLSKTLVRNDLIFLRLSLQINSSTSCISFLTIRLK